MNIPLRLLRGAVLLAGIHDALADLRLGPEGDDCPYANWISPIDVAASVRAGVDRIRNWGDPANHDLMDTALRLADLVSEAEGPLATGGAGQLVHGDFWDNNVYFRSESWSRSPTWTSWASGLASMISPDALLHRRGNATGSRR